MSSTLENNLLREVKRLNTPKITVMGLGYVGLATALTLSHLGHEVVGYDPVDSKIIDLANGRLPIHEDGLNVLLHDGLRSGRLSFTSEPSEALTKAEFAFICVGTPSLPDGQADLSQVRSAAEMIGRYMSQQYMIVIDKSTVPVGTGEKVEKWIREAQLYPRKVDVVSNPEFLREGNAIRDSLKPTRIVIGAESLEAGDTVSRLFEGLNAPILQYNRRTAEMIKYASNAFLATKISFINEIAAICDRVGADVSQVSEGMGYDPRIGSQFLRAGVGYGGSCFPKDTTALIQIAGNVYYDFKLLKAVVDVNNQSRLRVVQLLEEALGGLDGRQIAVLGLSFKPGTDDIRDAPALTVIPNLIERGARVRATDPAAIHNSIKWFSDLTSVSTALENAYINQKQVSNDNVLYLTSNVMDALQGADAILLLTEWPSFLELDWTAVQTRMKGNVVVDGRNALEPADVKGSGLNYWCIGRPKASSRMPDMIQFKGQLDWDMANVLPNGSAYKRSLKSGR